MKGRDWVQGNEWKLENFLINDGNLLFLLLRWKMWNYDQEICITVLYDMLTFNINSSNSYICSSKMKIYIYMLIYFVEL